MKLSPIVLFVYHRLWHTQNTVEALQKNELSKDSELFIYADNAKYDKDLPQVQAVRDYLKTIDGFKKITIIERNKNWGLADSIIDGVTKIVNEYGKIIVLEDDLVTSPFFLKFMNESLDMYQDSDKVASIHGYIYPINDLPHTFFIKGADCWGWATWRDRWGIFEPDGKKLLNELTLKNLEKEADFNNSYGFTQMLKDQINAKNNSWAIRWYMSAFLKDMVTLYPGKSYVKNIGFGKDATHCTSTTNVFDVILSSSIGSSKIDIKEDVESRRKIEIFFNSFKHSIFQRIISKLKRLIK